MSATKFPLRLLVILCSAAFATTLSAQTTGPKGATVLLIRHAEKPDDGDGLTPAGEARTKAYVGYFQNLKFHDESLQPDTIFAAADSHHSRRPRLTVEPLAQALKIPVNTTYKDKDFASLAAPCKPATTTRKSSSAGTTARCRNCCGLWARTRTPSCPVATGRKGNMTGCSSSATTKAATWRKPSVSTST